MDQIRTVSNVRLGDKIGSLSKDEAAALRRVITEMYGEQPSLHGRIPDRRTGVALDDFVPAHMQGAAPIRFARIATVSVSDSIHIGRLLCVCREPRGTLRVK